MGKLEQEWHEHNEAIELLEIWAGLHSTIVSRKNYLLRSLANTDQLAAMLPDYIRKRSEQLTFTGTVNHAFSIAKEIGHGRTAGLVILDTILDLAMLEKKSGKNMREANKTIIDVYLCAPPQSQIELKAQALMPTSEEYREYIESIRFQKSEEARPLLQIPYNEPS